VCNLVYQYIKMRASSSRFYSWRWGILVQRWRYFYYKYNLWQGNSNITISDTACPACK